jgi:hypothetical protein
MLTPLASRQQRLRRWEIQVALTREIFGPVRYARLWVGLWALHCGAPTLRSGVPATGRFFQ